MQSRRKKKNDWIWPGKREINIHLRDVEREITILFGTSLLVPTHYPAISVSKRKGKMSEISARFNFD